jgi:beta-mannosidase
MPPTTLSLNGDWQFKDYYGEDWRWRDAHMPVHTDTRFWRTGSVPGSVHDDLWRAGEIPNPYFERNSLLLEWIPARTWLYRRTFSVPHAMQGQRVQLRFEGVDYSAEFYLNGALLGRHASMYTPAIFDVTALLNTSGDNTLAVVIDPAPHEQPQVSRSDKVRTHKSRMTYWWDFCPRMPHIGIWDSVTLVSSGSVRIDDAFVRPLLNADFTQADLAIALTLDSQAAQSVAVDVTIRLDGQTVTQAQQPHNIATGANTLNLALTLDNPALWWPNGYGEQPIYEAEISVRNGTPEPSDVRTVRFGVRKVELVANATPDDTALPYTFLVNGRRLYINGWNWVPQDVLYGVPGTARLERLMTLAQNAHVNLLRIWGGGLIEREAFYEQCDRRGLMVWQEFIQSSSGIDNNPPQTPDFIALMEREAEQIIPRKRNHPSLVLWCGGNELTTPDITPLDDTHPLLAALKRIVNRLDPDRLWLATSPTGRVFINGLEEIERDPTGQHDVHGPWEYQGVTGQYTLYNAGTSLLHSEFGVEGITNLKTLNATIAPEHQSPVSLDNPNWFHLGAWWVKLPRWRETFGDLPDVPAWVRATQYMQASGLQYALEADRRRWPQNSGTLPWQFNEPYPMAACTSAIDYYAQPKPLYYAVARAYAPLHVSARFATAAWDDAPEFTADCFITSAHAQPLDGLTLRARLVAVDGAILAAWEAPASVSANAVAQVLALAHPLDGVSEVFFLDLALTGADGATLASNRYAFTRAANLATLLTVAPTTLDVQANGDTLTVTNTGSVTAMYVWLEDARPLNADGYVYFSDNHFCLFPGETRTITATWQSVATHERRLTVQAWNTPQITIESST